MKTSSLISLCAAMLLASACTQDELPCAGRPSYAAEAIAFTTPYTTDEPGTRSFAMRQGTFNPGDRVGVLGFCQASNQGTDYSSSPWNTKKDFCTPDIFYNQELTYSGTGSWDYNWTGTGNISGLHPWLDDEAYTYAFFAYYPYAEMTETDRWTGEQSGTISGIGITDDREGLGTITLSGTGHRGDPAITYTMPHSLGSSPTAGCDWWVVPDFMLGYKTDHLRRDGSVKLNFRHLFCAFEFRINNYNDSPITIKDLYIGGGRGTGSNRTSGFYRSVSVTGQQTDYTVDKSDIYIGRYHIVGRDPEDTDADPHVLVDMECPEANGDQPSSTPIYYEGEPVALLFIPDEEGKLTSDGNESLYISLTVEQNGETIFDERERTMNLESVSFEPGVRSIFNINIVGNNFTLQVQSDGRWEDGGDSDIVFE